MKLLVSPLMLCCSIGFNMLVWKNWFRGSTLLLTTRRWILKVVHQRVMQGKVNPSEGMWDAISGSAGGFGSPWPNHDS